jgi:UDP-N-acetylmuramoyl-L-alanine--D-glutamate ligase
MERVLVLGLGKTGRSVLRFFSKKEEVIVGGYAEYLKGEERSELAQAFPHTYFYSGPLHEIPLHKFELLILSPGISLYRPELRAYQRQGGKIINDVTLWRQYVYQTGEKIIAITGSNGKSTVTEWVKFLCRSVGLKAVSAGNIGLPLLDARKDNPDIKVWVLELSSFQLEIPLALNADAAACLNISQDHLDRYTSLEDYVDHKKRIFAGAKTVVLNGDDPLTQAMAFCKNDVRYFSVEKKSDYWLDASTAPALLKAGEEILCSSEDLALPGKHNIANALAAFALVEAIGVDRKRLVNALPFFTGLTHRVEKVATIGAVTFIDDSKGTNVGATAAALKSAPASSVLIAGGLGKGQNFAPLNSILKEKATAIVLIGQDRAEMKRIFSESGIKIVEENTLEEATYTAFALAKKTGAQWVLLSPAAASMDMFKDYAHRAQVFIDTVKEIAHAEQG